MTLPRLYIFFGAQLLASTIMAGKPKIFDTCYSLVGCFSNYPPWTTPSRPALPPMHPLNVSDTMKMFTRDSRNGITFDSYPELDLDVTYANRSIFFIFYGHRGNSSELWVETLTQEILNQVDGVVFVPEYNLVSSSYEQAIGDVRVVARLSALVIKAIEADTRLVHLIGHGIGAHFASYVANIMFQAGKDIGRVTGLDPTRLYYEGQHKDMFLDKTDALYVEIWHTSAGTIGFLKPNGHVDYYINGGTEQPACKSVAAPAECSHQMAVDIFVETIKDTCLSGQLSNLKFDGDAITSLEPDLKAGSITIGYQREVPRGSYLVVTNSEPPFCIGLDENQETM